MALMIAFPGSPIDPIRAPSRLYQVSWLTVEASLPKTKTSEPELNKGVSRRKWTGKREQQAAVYANRRRINGNRGKQLLRRRGELRPRHTR